MCGRCGFPLLPEATRKLFRIATLRILSPRYNIAPTEAAPVTGHPEAQRLGCPDRSRNR
jgi:hypothetical protein